MEERADYLADILHGEIRKRGYRKEPPSESRALPRMNAAYRHDNGNVLRIEYKMPHLYRAEEFRALIGDAILRFEKAGSSVPGERLLLAILLGRMSPKAGQDLQAYASQFLPGLQWFLLSEDGQAYLRLDGQDQHMKAAEPFQGHGRIRAGVSRAGLFSPKSQWLWKLLLMPGMDRRFWGGPPQKPRNVKELAEISHVSQPSVSSFISRAEAAGFLRRVSNGFVVERHEELLEDWVYAVKHGRREESPLQFIYPDEPEEQWLKKVRAFCKRPRSEPAVPPLVIGSHLACHLVGLGRSNIRLPWLYADGKRAEIMAALDLAEADPGHGRLALVALASPDSVFGGPVWVDNLPVCDVLQSYLDVRLSPARGLEQSEFIMNRILRPHFEGRN